MMCNCLLCHLSHRSSILFLLSENRNKSDKQTCFGWRENLTSQVRKMLERFCNSEEVEEKERRQVLKSATVQLQLSTWLQKLRILNLLFRKLSKKFKLKYPVCVACCADSR